MENKINSVHLKLSDKHLTLLDMIARKEGLATRVETLRAMITEKANLMQIDCNFTKE